MTRVDAAACEISLDLPDETATRRLAQKLAPLAGKGDLIALWGDLGTGKTAFARAFIKALPAPADVSGQDEEVPSPTFTLVQTYARLPVEVWHFDLYRVERPADVYELGIEEALAEGITLVEWPQRMGALLPPDRLDVRLAFADDGGVRRATLGGHGAWRHRLAEAFGHD
jgi:tRNA threonylcarbamoyladenosine biosynthesis protein TsaE